MVVNIFVWSYGILEFKICVTPGNGLFQTLQCRQGDLCRHARVVFQQGDVCLERCAFACLGHARQEKRRQFATANRLPFCFFQRRIECAL